MKTLKKGDTFVLNGVAHTASCDSHICGDASCDEYVVYDEDDEGWFEPDFPEVSGDEEKEGEELLIDVIDQCLPNSYKVLEGDRDVIYVVERATGRHYAIHVTECEE